MAVTRLKRKHRKNIARANNKQRVIKQLLATPVIKNVDPEELKAQFGKNTDANVAKPAAAPKPEAGVVNSVKEAISGAAQTVADKVSDVVEAVKDKVEDVLNKEEKESAE
jgi:hypothetical protein